MGIYSTIFEKLRECDRNTIYVVGGGGKTTFMEEMAKYIKNLGYSVVITTTVKVASPRLHNYMTDHSFLDEAEFLLSTVKRGESTFLALRNIDTKRVEMPRRGIFELLKDRFDYVIVEADGSRGLPLKIHSDRDPVVFSDCGLLITIVGISGVLERTELMVFGEASCGIVDRAYLNEYFKRSDGALKGSELARASIALFNGYDAATSSQIEEVEGVELPLGVDGYIVSLKKDILYEKVNMIE